MDSSDDAATDAAPGRREAGGGGESGSSGRRASRWLSRAGRVLVLAALLAGVLTIVISPSTAEHFLFFPDDRDPGPPPTLAGVQGERVPVTASDGRETFAWHFRADPDAPTVVLLHGNAANVADRIPLARGFVSRGLSVFMQEYRGYGGTGGAPSIPGVIRDAVAGLERAAERAGGGERLVLFGRSLGGAVGLQAVDEARPAAVILEATFTSLRAMAQEVYPILPGFLFRRLEGVLDSESAVRELEAPLLIVHGTADRIVPFRMGRELRDAAPGSPGWYPVERAGHNDVYLVGGEEYFDRLADFARSRAGG